MVQDDLNQVHLEKDIVIKKGIIYKEQASTNS